MTARYTIDELGPVERLALLVSYARVKRGEPPSENAAVVCVRTLARLTGLSTPTPADGEPF